MAPHLTVVIVNWNGGSLLTRCLHSLKSHPCVDGMNVVVVDNDSSDGSRETAIAEFPDIRVINSGANLGFGRANNLARAFVDTPFVLFLNPDTEVLAGALDRALNCIVERPEVGAVGCRMMEPDGTVQELGLQWSMTPLTALAELLLVTRNSRKGLRRWLPTVDAFRSGYVEKLYGGFLLVRKPVLDAAGWFDERYFMYAEDADLSHTIRRLGHSLYYCADAVIVHVGGGVTARAPSHFNVLMKQESINKLIAKYQGPTSAILHRAAVCAGGTARLGVALAGGLTSGLFGNTESRARWGESRAKQQQLVLWSLGFRRAHVPLSRPKPNS